MRIHLTAEQKEEISVFFPLTAHHWAWDSCLVLQLPCFTSLPAKWRILRKVHKAEAAPEFAELWNFPGSLKS